MDRNLDAWHGALAHVALLVFAALPPAALALVRMFGDHRGPEGHCEGLGWGCAPSQSSTAALLLLFVLPIMVLWAAGGTVALALLRRRLRYRERPALVQGLLPVAPALVLAAIGLPIALA